MKHRNLYSKNLTKPESETLFEEDINKVKDEERGLETTYITIKKSE